MKRKYLFIVLTMLFLLACVVPTAATVDRGKSPASTELPARVNTLPTVTPKVYTVCRAYNLRLRVDAGTDQKEMALLADGTTVTRTETEPKYPSVIAWYEVEASDMTGWVSSKYLCEE